MTSPILSTTTMPVQYSAPELQTVDISSILHSLEDSTPPELTAEQQQQLQFMQSQLDPQLLRAMTDMMHVQNLQSEAARRGVDVPGFSQEEVDLENKLMAAHMKGEDTSAMMKELDALRARNRAN